MSALADTWDDLDESMADIDGSELVGDNVDPTLPDRMIRAIARERRKVAHAEAVVAAEKDRLDAWLERRRAVHDTSFLEAALAGYHEARLAREPKLKTIHLPSGDLVARKQPDRWDIDDDAFLAWASEHHPDLIRVRPPEVDRAAVKKALTVHDDGRVIDGQSGEVVPAITVEAGGITFAVKVGNDLA